MSGTSLDGVDAVVCTCRGRQEIRLEHHWSASFPPALRRRLHSAAAGEASSWETGQLHHDLGRFLARVAGSGPKAGPLDAAGMHGQTLYHNAGGRAPATLQIGEAAYLAEALRVPVVSNFRAGDLAAGGHGAPLATLFHQAVFARKGHHIAVNNLGGISNVTSLDWTDTRAPAPRVLAFDTGPANVLLDLAVRHRSDGRSTHDRDGRWAGRGWIAASMVERWLKHPYFRTAPPKSTGRELFGESFWKREMLTAAVRRLGTEDLLATLTGFTARSVALSQHRFLRRADGGLPEETILCGGGAANPVLGEQISAALAEFAPAMRVTTVREHGWPIQCVEPAAFALLTHYHLSGWPANLPSTTGARHPCLLGQLTLPPPG